MGEPVSVIQKLSAKHGVVRFDTNRSFTGMGHESYRLGEPIWGHRPPDEVARVMFDTGKVDEVHVYGQTISVQLRPGASAAGLKEALEGLYIHYKPGVEIPSEDSFS
jgi:hypothetical protein